MHLILIIKQEIINLKKPLWTHFTNKGISVVHYFLPNALAILKFLIFWYFLECMYNYLIIQLVDTPQLLSQAVENPDDNEHAGNLLNLQ